MTCRTDQVLFRRFQLVRACDLPQTVRSLSRFIWYTTQVVSHPPRSSLSPLYSMGRQDDNAQVYYARRFPTHLSFESKCRITRLHSLLFNSTPHYATRSLVQSIALVKQCRAISGPRALRDHSFHRQTLAVHCETRAQSCSSIHPTNSVTVAPCPTLRPSGSRCAYLLLQGYNSLCSTDRPEQYARLKVTKTTGRTCHA